MFHETHCLLNNGFKPSSNTKHYMTINHGQIREVMHGEDDTFTSNSKIWALLISKHNRTGFFQTKSFIKI